MAYAALISLKLTIQRILKSSQIPIPSSCPEIIELAYQNVKSLQELFTLEYGRNNERVKAVEKEIREASCRLEDVLESAHVSNQHFLSQSETVDGDEISYLASMKVEEEINLFTETAEKIKEQFSNTLLQPEEYKGEIEEVIPSRTDHFLATKSKIFGLDSDLMKLKDLLRGYHLELKIFSVVGMAGIGKTTLAKEVYGDPDILNHYECCAFVSIGPEYRLREILLGILAQINHPMSSDELYEKHDQYLAMYVFVHLCRRRFLIVLDDVWNVEAWDIFRSIFPNKVNGSRILLTSRIEGLADYAGSEVIHKMQFLTEKDSWHLLCEKVFGEGQSCPPQIEKAGKKIAKKCEGLPLAIIVMGKHLSKAEKTSEYWSKVAEREISNIIGADTEMSKVLYLSYKYLPQYLKPCFLYMGVFPHDYEIPPSKLINLWCAEGFLEPYSTNTLEDHAMVCLEDLVSRTVVLVRQQSSSNKIKTCRLHSVFHHLCIKEAGKDKFFHILDSYANQGIESQPRLCILNNVLFGIKHVNKLMASRSDARSLLCTGAHHQHPIPMCLGFRLLRVLDALTIRFYGFPIEVVKLFQLRYLSFTYNGKLPASISNLQNLQYLTVHQYLSIISSVPQWSYLPVEIWHMQELRHLKVMGSDLPNPSTDDALLPNLLILLGISTRSCTKEVLERIPNLKKLGIRIELPLEATEPLCCFDHLASLCRLESLKCIIMNPNKRLQVFVPTPPVSIFPSSLRKLTLSGLGFPWEYMSNIAYLPNLKVLKLRSYAFQGPVWEASEEGFEQLRFLLIEDTNLEYWRVDDTHFPHLERLFIQHCYKLKEIPLEIGEIPTLEMIEIVDGSPSLVASAKQILEEQQSWGYDYLQVCVKYSSEDDHKTKS